MSSISSSSEQTTSIDHGRIWWVGLLAVVVAVVANLIVRAIVFAIWDLPAEFPPLQVGAIAFLTAVGLIAATAVFAVVARVASRPIRTYRIIGVVAFIVSILPNLGLAANPSAAPFPGGSSLTFLVLVIFHVVAAAIAIGLLTTLTRE